MRISFSSFIKRPYDIAIALMMLWVVFINFEHSFWKHEKVIQWDVISYYSYLPATVIHNDLSLEFTRADSLKYSERIWYVYSPTGKKAIVTSMGMSILYSPFFFVAHTVAHLTPYEADGYSIPYSFALNFSTLFYVLAGLIFLRKILLRWFTPWVTTFTLIAVFVGTNLFYYTTFEAAVSHGFNFALIAAFLYLTIRWYDSPGSIWRIAGLGLLAGLITLVRPTNIIVLLLFFLWGIDSRDSFRRQFLYYLRRPALVGVMALCFVLVWIPQFIYWKYVSGMFFYFSYGEIGGGFFWDNPQIMNILFSYKKGWFIYTPLMFFAFIGIFTLPGKVKGTFLPILVFQLVNIYILASWWSWWFGGGFGLRSFVDTYAIMAIPFAALVTAILRQKRFVSIPALGLFAVLIWYSYFQMRQYHNGAIHYWWMNKDAYWETFLKRRPTERFWTLVTLPDYELARKGIYVEIPLIKKENPLKRMPDHQTFQDFIIEQLKKDSLLFDSNTFETTHQQEQWLWDESIKLMQNLDSATRYLRLRRILAIEQGMRNDPQTTEFILKKALERNLHPDTMFRQDAIWIYENNKGN